MASPSTATCASRGDDLAAASGSLLSLAADLAVRREVRASLDRVVDDVAKAADLTQFSEEEAECGRMRRRIVELEERAARYADEKGRMRGWAAEVAQEILEGLAATAAKGGKEGRGRERLFSKDGSAEGEEDGEDPDGEDEEAGMESRKEEEEEGEPAPDISEPPVAASNVVFPEAASGEAAVSIEADEDIRSDENNSASHVAPSSPVNLPEREETVAADRKESHSGATVVQLPEPIKIPPPPKEEEEKGDADDGEIRSTGEQGVNITLLNLEEHILLDVFSQLDAVDVLNVAQTSIGMYSRVDILFGLGSSLAGGDVEEDLGDKKNVSEGTDAPEFKVEQSDSKETQKSSTKEETVPDGLTLEEMEDLFDEFGGSGEVVEDGDKSTNEYADFDFTSKNDAPKLPREGIDVPPPKEISEDEKNEKPAAPPVPATLASGQPNIPTLSSIMTPATAAPASRTQSSTSSFQNALSNAFKSKATRKTAEDDGIGSAWRHAFKAKDTKISPGGAKDKTKAVADDGAGGASAIPNAFLSFFKEKSAGPATRLGAAPTVQPFQGIDPVAASSLADKLSPSELAVIIDMTERVRQSEAEARAAVTAADDAGERLAAAERSRDILAVSLSEAKATADSAVAESRKEAVRAAEDAEALAHLEEQTRVLEKEKEEAAEGRRTAEKKLAETKEKHGDRVQVLEDLLVYEQERCAEAEEGAKAIRKVLAREVKRCRTEISVLKTERNGYRDQLKALKKAVMNGRQRR
uniref:F-box domain-containing protein n=1 Tax=Corethron hystrix TaxID=216773 RepID=A0A7S1BSS9_9STRA|mmetsp:Transcript_38149/g.88778  ORF Transcript_38149/g.88778 Transcript_38149/m.88778 type:complete len:754 (+) Transcript_38149:264-2525(+)